MLSWLWSWSWWILATLVDWLWRAAKERPYAAFLVALAIVRSFGTTVQTGSVGVLFSFGRAKKVLQPGFHPLVPVVQQVRHQLVRSITLDLPKQRVMTADELVYDVDANVVYRVEDAIVAATAIDDVKQGVLTVIPLLVQELLREQTRQTLTGRQALDHELIERARQKLARWGVTVETAGMSTIAPTRPTVRLTQLPARVAERRQLLAEQTAAGLDVHLAAALTLGQPGPQGRAAARYRRHRLPFVQDAGARAQVSVTLPRGGWLTVGETTQTWNGTQVFETPKLEAGRQYVYTLVMNRQVHGFPVSETRTVEVAAGKKVAVDFTKPA